MDAIILAGGKGSRMSGDKPKALVEVRGKTILEWQLNYVLPHVNKVVLAVGHKGEIIEAFVREKYSGKNIVCAKEEGPLGTAGALRNALVYAQSDFVLVLNADDLTDMDIEKLTNTKENTICVCHPRLPFGLVKSKDGYAEFVEKPLLKERVSCGWYVFNRTHVEAILPAKGSLEYDVFPSLRLRVYPHNGFWKPLNTPKDIEEAEKMELEKLMR
jgi:NDP-sugar pyrophosphorylase family protein